MNPAPERLLVEQAKTDETAFTKLYEHYLPKIYGYIYKRVGARQEAEDLTSKTFLKMLAHLPRFKGDHFKSWLYRIAANTVIDHFRTFHGTEDIGVLENLPAPEGMENPREDAEKSELKKEVFGALNLLPKKYSEIIYLKYYGDLSNEEIAHSLGITENNASVLLHRALKEFKKNYTYS